MAKPTPQQIADIILSAREVYGLEIDSIIRQASNQLTGRALFELLAHVDDEVPSFRSDVAALLDNVQELGHSMLISFDSEFGSGGVKDEESQPPPTEPIYRYLKLIFADKDAAYYQFHLFPNLNADYVLGAARKREGEVQHIRIDLSGPDGLQRFIEDCRRNPHFVRIEQSSEEEFTNAKSNGV